MEDLENKLSAIMSDPEMMGKIMNLAQSFEQGESQPKQNSPGDSPGFPDIDLSMLQKLSGAARQTGIDQNQKSLLHALTPYLNSRRIRKLERAMRAAKVAGMAGSFLNLTGR